MVAQDLALSTLVSVRVLETMQMGALRHGTSFFGSAKLQRNTSAHLRFKHEHSFYMPSYPSICIVWFGMNAGQRMFRHICGGV